MARKKATSKVKETSTDGTSTEPSNPWYKIWPKDVVDKHVQRQAANKELMQHKINHKKQRLFNNGVPPEKHSH